MTSILNLFGLGRNKYPMMDYKVREEGISYTLPDKTIFIATTHIGGQRIFTDSLDLWNGKGKLNQTEKSTIFADAVKYMKKEVRKKLIIVINIDFNKDFWENECEKMKNYISKIEYTSEKEKKEFEYNMFLDFIPNLTIKGHEIKTKEDLDNYFANKRTE